MRHPISFLSVLLSILACSPLVRAERIIQSSSLNSCQEGSNFTATLFNVAFTPANNSIGIDIVGVSSLQGNVTAQLEVIAYGFTVLNETLDPCAMGLRGMCPLSTGQINIETNIVVPEDIERKVPGIAYSVPDLDGVVRIYIQEVGTLRTIACMEAHLSNTKTVDQKAVGWVTAVIAGLGLIASGVTSGMGHTNTAAHVAANALSLFGFFQAQAIIGMTSVQMPPIVQSWTQNFQWSMGIIRVGFLQSVCTWYQRATGGTPTTYLSTLALYSVQVEKRSLDMVKRTVSRSVQYLAKRDAKQPAINSVIIVRGIDRVGFRAGIEQTNIFMTGLIFFIIVLVFVAILVAIFKGFCEMAVRAKWMKSDKFAEFRNGWKIVLKGILFRLVLLGYVQMCVLCLWELVERDSAAEVIVALFVFLSMSAALGWAALKVIRLAKRSMDMHKSPAYILYSDPECLNKWGFLYVQYRATAYYFVLPMLGYILVKAIFVAFAQSSPIAQAVGLVIVEAVALIGVSVLRPFMDKKTNIFNISIAAVNFVNAIFLLIFSNAFGQPEMVSGIMGVLFAFYNVVFAAILLILVLIASIYAIAAKNPETRYQPMRDDRGSFIKSQPALTTELDALGATARGGANSPYDKSRGFGDDASVSSASLNRLEQGQSTTAATALPPAAAANPPYTQERPSTTDGSPVYPSEAMTRRGPAPGSDRQQPSERPIYRQGYNGNEASPNRPRTASAPYSNNNTSTSTNNFAYPRKGSSDSYHNNSSNSNNSSNQYYHQQPPVPQFRQQAAPNWQVGAGYDHAAYP